MANTSPKQLGIGEFTMSVPEGVPELYVDGVTGVMLGWPISKLVFHTVWPRVPGDTSELENRRAAAVVAINTTTLVEMSRNVLANLAGSAEQIVVGDRLLLEKTLAMLSGIKIVAVPEATEGKPEGKAKKKG